MAKVSICPGVEDLHKLGSGLLMPAAMDSLVEHMETCPECLAKVQTLSSSDSLSAVLTQASRQPDGPNVEVVAQLIARLKKLPTEQAYKVFACAKCAKPLHVKAEVASKQVRCPHCGHIMQAPGAAVIEESTLALLSAAPSVSQTTDLGGAAKQTDAEEAWDFLAPPQAPDEIGRLGAYRILEVLGRGGMGAVFRAEDTSLKRLVALKALLPSLAASTSAKMRFVREAQAAASIHHDRIVTIHQVGEDRGIPFLTMEFLHGEPLDARLKREGTLPIPEVLRIGKEVAEGLAIAHKAGLVHRDIKPANIWLEQRTSNEGSRVKILDFGLARATAEHSSLTQTGTILGTPQYMAPEQARGDNVDARCDLFSLGCMLYVMSTGRLPFRGHDAISTLMSVATDEAAVPHSVNSAIPLAVSRLIQQLLAKDPAQRPASAAEVADALHALETQASTEGTSVLRCPDLLSAAKPVIAWNKRRGLLTACGLAFLAVVAAAVFFLQTPKGTIRIEINDDNIEVVLAKAGTTIKGADKNHDITVAAGEHALQVKRGDLELETDKFVLKKNETVTLRVEFLHGKLEVKNNAGKLLGASRAPSRDNRGATAWQPTDDQQTFIDFVAKLPIKDRVESVTRRLKEINAAIEREVSPVYQPKDGAPTTGRLSEAHVYRIWPLAALPSLTALDLSGAGVVDFTPLARLPLTELKMNLLLDDTASEAALKSISTLKTINGRSADEYWTERAQIRREIDQMVGKIKGLSLKDRMTWFAPLMKKLNPQCTAGFVSDRGPNRNEFALWAEGGRLLFSGRAIKGRVFDISPVRALDIEGFHFAEGMLFDIRPLAHSRIQSFSLSHNFLLRDISPLAGLPLTVVQIPNTLVSDLRPLKNMRLRTLVYDHTAVTDLSAIKGMPLEFLTVHSGQLPDLTLLEGMKLQQFLGGRSARDISLLKGMPLKNLDVGFRLYFPPDEQQLRSLPLEKINDMPVAEFWKDVAKRRQADQAFVEATLKLTPEKAAAAVKAAVDARGLHGPTVKIVDGAVVEATISDGRPWGNGAFLAPLRAFPKLRKLILNVSPNLRENELSPLLVLPLEELDITSTKMIEYNKTVLRAMQHLKTINGKPAKEVLDATP